VDLPAQTTTSHTLLTLPDTLTELDLLLPPDPTILSQSLASGRDTTLLSNAFDLSMEYPRGLADEDDPLSQFPGDVALDFALDDGRSFSVEQGRDAVSIGLDDEFGSVRGLDDDMGFKQTFEEDDGLGGGFDGGLDFGFGEDLPIGEQFEEDAKVPHDGTSILCKHSNSVDFADALLRPQEDEEEVPVIVKVARQRKLLTADSEIEISKKEYSTHLKDVSNIIKKVPRLQSLQHFTLPSRLNRC
jgi:hypothetical protein